MRPNNHAAAVLCVLMQRKLQYFRCRSHLHHSSRAEHRTCIAPVECQARRSLTSKAQPHSTYTDGGDLARSSNGGRSIAAIGCTLMQRGSRARQRSVYSDEPQYHENHCASMGCSFPALRRKLHHRIGLIVGLPLLAMPEPSKALAVRESRMGKKMYDVVR